MLQTGLRNQSYNLAAKKSKLSVHSNRSKFGFLVIEWQRWSPRGRPWSRRRSRGHILKSLALSSKVKSLALASRPQVLENWPVLGSRTAVFFELLKFCEALEKFTGKRFFVEIAGKIFVKTFFFSRALALVFLVLGFGLEHFCPWPRECLSSEKLSLASDFFCVLGLGLEACVLDPPLLNGSKTRTIEGSKAVRSYSRQQANVEPHIIRTSRKASVDTLWLKRGE